MYRLRNDRSFSASGSSAEPQILRPKTKVNTKYVLPYVRAKNPFGAGQREELLWSTWSTDETIRTGSAMSCNSSACSARPALPFCCCSSGENKTESIIVNGMGNGYSGNSSGRVRAARKHEEPGSSVALVRVFLTPRKSPVRRASRREDSRRDSA